MCGIALCLAGSYSLCSHNCGLACVLLQLLNVLVVAPESLLGLVNGSLRMVHRCAHACQ